MKKLFTIIILLAATLQCVDAQVYRSHRNTRYRTGHVDYNRNRGFSGRGFYRSVQPDQYFGLRIGPAFTNVSSDDAYLGGGNMQTGLNVGFVWGKALTYSEPLYFETGFNYTEKGGKSDIAGNKFTYDLNYLTLPFTLKYIWTPDGDFTVQPFFGGYLGCGVAGKIKDFGDRAAYESFSDTQNTFRRFDGGLKFGCGVGYDMLYAEIAYELGLANISHDSFDTAHNRALMLNFGINF